MGALATLQEENKCSEETKAKADVFLHQYIDEMLEFEYSNCDDPSILWKDLETRFNNQREVLLPSARDEWNNLRFQDFKKVNEYTSALFRICGTLRFCGQSVTEADMLEKTFSTFHASHINLQQQYRLQNFKRYFDLNVKLFVAEKNNELFSGHNKTTGSLELPEANSVNNNDSKNSGSKRGRAQYQAKDGELCIADSGAIHTVLKSKKYFFELKPTKGTIDTISGPTNLIDEVGKANVVLPNGTQLLIENALFSLKSKRNLLSFRNIYHNGYDTRSRTIGNKKYLHIINENQVFEKLPMLHSGLHYTHINVPQAHMTVKEKYCDLGIFSLWHDRLGHPGSTMMKRIVENTHGHPLKYQKFLKIDKVPLCTSCSLRKLIARPSPLKVENESPMFLERIQGNICGPVHTPCGPFRYFMVLIDASSRWSHVSLLSTRNVAFAKFLAQIIKLRALFPDYTVKRVRLNNAGEFTSHAFNDYCMFVGIVVEHPVAHVHTQNGLVESLIKRLQLIARPLIMRTKLIIFIWGHAILHAASLIRMRPSANHKYSPIQLASGQEPNISHFGIFGYAVYVPIALPQRIKMGPQRRLGIYVGYETSSIIRYIEPLIGDLFTACFVDCHFDEAVFPELGE
ncbi:disease resistance CC-NBS-LRR class family protein [Tanacetum coccineum]